MEKKKILIAVDSSENSERAVSYVGDMMDGQEKMVISLLYVERPPDRDIYPTEQEWKEAAIARELQIRTFLQKARKILEHKGVMPGVIEEEYVVSCKSAIHTPKSYCSPGVSIADEIIRIQREGGFETIVIGRRGVSKAEEFLFGSVSTSVMRRTRGGVIWVVA